MTLTTQSINLFKIAIITLALILAPVVLMYFTFGIASYTDLFGTIALSISVLILSTSALLIVVFKKEKLPIQNPWPLYLAIACSVLFMCSTMVLNNL